MTFNEVLSQTIAMLQQHGRVSYRALKRQFAIDDDFLEDLKSELVEVQQRAVDQDGTVLVWTGERSSVAERYHSFTQAVAVACGCSNLVGATRCNTSYHTCKITCKPLMTCDNGADPMASRVHAVAAMRSSRANGATTDSSASTVGTARRAWASSVPCARTGPVRSSRKGS